MASLGFLSSLLFFCLGSKTHCAKFSERTGCQFFYNKMHQTVHFEKRPTQWSGTHPKTLQCKKCKSDKCLRRIPKMLCIPAVRPAVVRGGPGSGLGAETGETPPPLGFRLRAGHTVHTAPHPTPAHRPHTLDIYSCCTNSDILGLHLPTSSPLSYCRSPQTIINRCSSSSSRSQPEDC